MSILEVLDKLDELEAKATPEEWIAHRSEIIRRDNDADPWFVVGILDSDDSLGTYDAEFVAPLRNAYPALSAELRRLREAVDERDQLVEKLVNIINHPDSSVVLSNIARHAIGWEEEDE